MSNEEARGAVLGGRRVLIPCHPPEESLAVRSEGVRLTFPDGEVVHLVTYQSASEGRIYLYAESNTAEMPEWYDVTEEPDWGLYFSFVTGATDLDIVAEEVPMPVTHLTSFSLKSDPAEEGEIHPNDIQQEGEASSGLRRLMVFTAILLLPVATLLLPAICSSLLVQLGWKEIASVVFTGLTFCNLAMCLYTVSTMSRYRGLLREWSTSEIHALFFRLIVETTFGALFVLQGAVVGACRLYAWWVRRKRV